MKNIKTCALIFFAFTLFTNPVIAARFTIGGSEEMNCNISLSGEIVEGDAERLLDFIVHNIQEIDAQTPYGPDLRMLNGNLCLDSVGGSFLEAIRIGDLFLRKDGLPSAELNNSIVRISLRTLGTAIPDGSTCLSACAILFMAGGYFDGVLASVNVREPRRFLHVGGSLGFHSPSLVVSDTSYSSEEVERAFQYAITAVGLINERRRLWYFSPSLLADMLSVGSDDFFYVDNVAKLGSYGIYLVGAPTIRDGHPGLLSRACRNLTLHSLTGWRANEQYGGAFWGSSGLGVGIRDGEAESSINSSGDEVWFWHGGWRPSCEIEFNASQGIFTQFSVDMNQAADHGLRFAGDGMTSNFNWALFPPYTSLRFLDLLADNFGSTIPGPTPMETISDTFTFSPCAGERLVMDLQGCTIVSEWQETAVGEVNVEHVLETSDGRRYSVDVVSANEVCLYLEPLSTCVTLRGSLSFVGSNIPPFFR